MTGSVMIIVDSDRIQLVECINVESSVRAMKRHVSSEGMSHEQHLIDEFEYDSAKPCRLLKREKMNSLRSTLFYRSEGSR